MNDEALLELAAGLALQAADAILAIRARGFAVSRKADRSVVTEADHAAEAIIVAGLREAISRTPVIAEEEVAGGAVTAASECFWLVDPLDGTREFTDGSNDFAVNIGLVRDGRVVLGVVGVPATGAITMWVPLMVFAFLFGLSMDYEVFILSRVREAYDASHDARTAVVTGLGRTGRLVTSAAAILMLGNAAMSTSGQTDLKILATGLGAGILVDAVVVRCLLVPAMVALFGRANWWLPAWAARLLRLPAAEEAAPAVTGAELTPVSSSVAVQTPW